ncbi:MAG: hypothetical protein ACHQ50_10250 [Fimbriimonadales bacterium]
MAEPFFRGRTIDNCYDCHKTAAIPLEPELEYTFDPKGSLIVKTSGAGQIPELLNRRIRGYGQIDLGVQRVSSYGPSLGPAGWLRSDESLRKWAGTTLSAESVARIRSAMNCASCHDSFGKLNFPMAIRTSRDFGAFKTDRGLVQSYIEKGYMPPGNSLTEQERHALWLCLSKEYYDPANGTGVFVDWLKGKP